MSCLNLNNLNAEPVYVIIMFPSANTCVIANVALLLVWEAEPDSKEILFTVLNCSCGFRDGSAATTPALRGKAPMSDQAKLF